MGYVIVALLALVLGYSVGAGSVLRDAGDGVCRHLYGYPQTGGAGDHGQAPQRHGVSESVIWKE